MPAAASIPGTSALPALTKAELTEVLCDNMALDKAAAKEVVDAFELMRDALAQGEELKLSGFGQFHLRQKWSRPGRNPRTGEAVPIAARQVVTFHASALLKERVQARLGGADDLDSSVQEGFHHV